jgi:hypothetical protein
MRRFTWTSALTFVAAIIVTTPLYAGKVNDLFNNGIFSVSWGANITAVKEKYPGGNTSEQYGMTTYRVNDGRTIVGIKRNPDNYIDYTFDSKNTLSFVKIQFTPSNDGDLSKLFPKLDEVFGADWYQPNKLNRTIAWPKDNNILVFFTPVSSDEHTLMIRAIQESEETKKDLGF